MNSVGPEAPARALGKICSGLYIVTAGAGDRQAAMLASWV